MEARVASLVLVLLAGCGGPAASFVPRRRRSTRRATRPPSTSTPCGPRARTRSSAISAHGKKGGDQAAGPALIATLRDEAARHGCDAVVLDHGYCVEEPDRYSLRSASAPLLVAYCVAMTGSQ